MYEAFYSLRARPFGVEVGVDECWLAPDVEQSLQHALASLQNGSAAVLISGPRGSGRTTLSRQLAQRLSTQRLPVFLGHCEFANPLDLWRTMLFELGEEFASLTSDDARLNVLQAARATRPDRDGLLVIADDADTLNDGMLDELRLLTLQRHDGRALVQLVLCGTFSLEERLASPEMNAFAERIGRHIVLDALDREQSRSYIAHRVESAGGVLKEVFSDSAMDAIIAAADGNLDCLNQLCDHALLLGFASEERPVTPATVAAALEDLKGLSLPWNIPVGAHGSEVVPRCDAERPQCAGEVETAPPDVESTGGETRLHVATGDETHMEVAEPNARQSWWDHCGDGAAIEVGAEDVSPNDSLSAAEPTSTNPVNDPSPMDTNLPEISDETALEILEAVVHDRYAALDRLAELDGSGVIDVPSVPTGTTFVWDSPAPTASPESHDDANDVAERPRTTNGIETRLLLDVAALRNELRAEAEAAEKVRTPEAAEPSLEMAPMDPQWDIVEPEPDDVVVGLESTETEPDDSHKPTEPMIEVGGLQSADDDESPGSSDGPSQRRYARLFTRLKERRQNSAKETAAHSLRLWR